jgi:hypothetical protein
MGPTAGFSGGLGWCTTRVVSGGLIGVRAFLRAGGEGWVEYQFLDTRPLRYLWPVPLVGTSGWPSRARSPTCSVTRGPSPPVGEGHIVVLYGPLLLFIDNIMATLWGYLYNAGAGRSRPSDRPAG